MQTRNRVHDKENNILKIKQVAHCFVIQRLCTNGGHHEFKHDSSCMCLSSIHLVGATMYKSILYQKHHIIRYSAIGREDR